MIDDRTTNLDLPLPHGDNALDDDVNRLRSAFIALDAAMPLKADLVAGKVPASQLPSYVDDVIEGATLAAFPGTGEYSKMYVSLDTGKIYRWSGSVYVEISASPGSTDAVPEGAVNQYFSVARVMNAVLTGLSLTTNAAISATDSILGALGKLQKQITDHLGSGGTAHAGATSSTAGFMSSTDKAKLDAVTLAVLGSEIQITPTSNGQTVFNIPGGYVAGQIWLFVNGIKHVSGDDFTATNGTSITLASGVNTTDTLEVVVFKKALSS